MTVVAVIPARYASTRFPGKPLAKQTGKYLIQHVYERVSQCTRIQQILVATDDPRVVDAVESFGGEARMTRSNHRSGTDRVGEVAAGLNLAEDDCVLNVQGDEPEVSADALGQLIDGLTGRDQSCRIGTLAARFPDDGPRAGPQSPLDPNCVKVVVDTSGRAMYFSRSAIPYLRQTHGVVDRPSRWLLHLGVYAFRVDALRSLTGSRAACPSALEEAESLEQLRWLEQGWPIAVVTVRHRFVGIDTPSDYAAFAARIASAPKAEPQELARGLPGG